MRTDTHTNTRQTNSMSSDIWHYHHRKQHHQTQEGSSQGFVGASFSRDKRSRSVLAMPNHSSELSSRKDLAAQRTRDNQVAASSRRPTYSGPAASNSKQQQQQIEGDSVSSNQRQQLSMANENLISGQNCLEPLNSNSQQASSSSGTGKQHAGPMGIFFKVWSLVKVTKSRHQNRQQQRQLVQHQNGLAQPKLRRQNSEDNSNYSADYPPRNAAILHDWDFRRAGSQPAPDRLQVHLTGGPAAPTTTTTTASSCTSSGVSSTTSSTLAANSSNSPSTTSSSSSPFRRQIFSAAAAAANHSKRPHTSMMDQKREKEQESWMSRMKKPQSSVRARILAAAKSRRRHSGGGAASDSNNNNCLLSLSLSTSDGSRSSSELRDEPEEDDQLDEDEESNDIYSTPNDSIQSVPSGQRAPTLQQLSAVSSIQTTTSQAYPIIKSFSTNNFQQAAAQQLTRTKQKNFAASKETLQERQNSTDSNRKQRLNGSRFFISSSSSEDSQPTRQNARQRLADKSSLPAEEPVATTTTTNSTDQQQQRPIPSCRQRAVHVDHGVHCHPSSSSNLPVRPQSLLLAGSEPINQFLVPIQMLTPIGGGATTTTTSSTIYLSPAAAAACLRSPAIINYQRSPSLFEFPPSNNTRFSSKYPPQVSSFQQQQKLQPPAQFGGQNLNQSRQSIDSNAVKSSLNLPNSISMYDFKQTAATHLDSDSSTQRQQQQHDEPIEDGSEYKLAQMMLESGSNPNASDKLGNTTLMLAVLSDNLPAVKCLIEHGANLNETNLAGLRALDLICTRQTTPTRLDILKCLIDNGADLDCQRDDNDPDASGRLLDRLIAVHQSSCWPGGVGSSLDKMAFIECLLANGAKLSSSTWCAASGKLEIQLTLLRKLCQDGYFLYKQSSIEAAVYRFEYALKRIAELEQQLCSSSLAFKTNGQSQRVRKQSTLMLLLNGRQQRSASIISPETASIACKKIKYQTYLGLSRCERKRKFYKRAFEFAQLAILVDSTSYEAFYSKAHILKDLGEVDDSLLTIDQTARLIEKSIENSSLELKYLDQQEELLIMDTCFDLDRESSRNQLASFARNRIELQEYADYLLEARKYVAKLRQDIMEDKFKSSAQRQHNCQITNNQSDTTNAIILST